ncbi:MAG: phosphoribosylglycinamide formyltransferase [Dehalococcoidia bacterium]
MLNLGWFSTGRGEGSRGLLSLVQERIASGELPARISFVFSNREPGEHEGSDRFFELVRSYGLPLVTFSSRRFRQAVGGDFATHRTEYDREVMARLSGYQPDICVLAGYMLIAGPELCRRYPLINLHPALPSGPVGTWQEVIWRLIESQATEAGGMIHLATEEVDRGPVIAYYTFSLRGEPFDAHWREVEGRPTEELKAAYGEELPLFRLIRQGQLRREPLLLLESLKALAVGTIRVVGQQVLDAQGKPVQGHCLNDAIERALRG